MSQAGCDGKGVGEADLIDEDPADPTGADEEIGGKRECDDQFDLNIG